MPTVYYNGILIYCNFSSFFKLLIIFWLSCTEIWASFIISSSSIPLEEIKNKIAHVPHKQILFYLSPVVTLLSCLSQTFSLSLPTNKPSFYLISLSCSCSPSPCSLLSPSINLCVRACMCVCMCACQREFIWISLQSLPITQVINQHGWWRPHPSIPPWVQMPIPAPKSLAT